MKTHLVAQNICKTIRSVEKFSILAEYLDDNYGLASSCALIVSSFVAILGARSAKVSVVNEISHQNKCTDGESKPSSHHRRLDRS